MVVDTLGWLVTLVLVCTYFCKFFGNFFSIVFFQETLQHCWPRTQTNKILNSFLLLIVHLYSRHFNIVRSKLSFQTPKLTLNLMLRYQNRPFLVLVHGFHAVRRRCLFLCPQFAKIVILQFDPNCTECSPTGSLLILCKVTLASRSRAHLSLYVQ